MNLVGVNWGYALVMAFNLLIIGVWPVLAIIALFGLRRRELSETVRALWAILIVAVPLLGAIAYWIVRPGEADRPSP